MARHELKRRTPPLARRPASRATSTRGEANAEERDAGKLAGGPQWGWIKLVRNSPHRWIKLVRKSTRRWIKLVRISPLRVDQAHENHWIKLVGNDNVSNLHYLIMKPARAGDGMNPRRPAWEGDRSTEAESIIERYSNGLRPAHHHSGTNDPDQKTDLVDPRWTRRGGNGATERRASQSRTAEIWLSSSYSARSLDSRYVGAIDTARFFALVLRLIASR
jgi:hypothetical protein